MVGSWIRRDLPRSRFPAVALLLLVLCGAFPAGASALSTEEERVLGEKFLIEIQRHFEIVDDDFVNDFLQGLGRYTLSSMEDRLFDFRFYLVKDNTLNAFAIPGGYIFIFSGLVEVMDSVDELAAVVCHEIGHIAARHIAQRIEQNKKIGLATMAGVLAGVLLGAGPVAEALISGSMAAGIQAQLHYSRNDERQADQMGFKYMKASGFDPSGMVTTLKKIDRGQWLGTDKVPAYLLTHPTGPERMANLDAMLEDYRPSRPQVEPERFRNLFPAFKAVSRAKTMDAPSAERLFKADLDKRPRDPYANLGLGLIYREKSDYDQAALCFKKASEEWGIRLPALRYLAETYQLKGQTQEALNVLQDALRLDDRDPGTLFLLATTYEAMGRYPDAVLLLERLASGRQVKTEVLYHLGISYGKMQKLGPAHYHFGLYFVRMGQRANALFHLKKAEELSADNPALLKQIRQALEGLSRQTREGAVSEDLRSRFSSG